MPDLVRALTRGFMEYEVITKFDHNEDCFLIHKDKIIKSTIVAIQFVLTKESGEIRKKELYQLDIDSIMLFSASYLFKNIDALIADLLRQYERSQWRIGDMR